MRLSNNPGLAAWIEASGIAAEASARMASRAEPVRAVLFDKSQAANWSVGWHQDRTIAVAARQDVPGFDRWNRKAGIDHVEPPFALLERMITARIHLDRVTAENSPLLIAPGSHRLGRVAEADTERAVNEAGIYTCLAEIGDVWLYATPILHASASSASGNRRRVLQLDFSADPLPEPLEWLGIGAQSLSIT